jgi:hypothetical protein
LLNQQFWPIDRFPPQNAALQHASVQIDSGAAFYFVLFRAISIPKNRPTPGGLP